MADTTIKSVYLTYTCFACPPEGISIHKNYVYSKDEQGDYIVCGNEDKIYLDINVIKMLFSPKDTEWENIIK